MDQPKMERLLRLMKLLISNRRYTIEDIADKLNTSERSIYRYIDTFKAAGFCITKNGDYYEIIKENYYFKDISQLVHFTPEEAYIVNQVIEGVDDTNVLKQNLKKKLASIYQISNVPDTIIKGKNSVNVHELTTGIENMKKIKLVDYCSANTLKVSDRIVEPFKFNANYSSVWCFDLKDNKNKIFKIARIGAVEVLDENWDFEKFHSSGFTDVFRMSGPNEIKISLELNMRAYNLLIEEYPLAEKEVVKVNEDTWILKTNVTNMQGIGRFYMGLADGIKILEGDELKSYVKNFMKLIKID